MLLRTTVLVGAALFAGTSAPALATPQDSRVAHEEQTVYFTSQELENLLAPIALYPDAILAQVLVAATFPDQIEFAARHVRARGTRGIDDQPWDVSVKAVAYYPPVLNMMADRPDWTTALGQAYAVQSGDVMEAVQQLREMADEHGNLRTTSHHRVVRDGRVIIIEPANPRIIYVPTYDPYVVYYRPIVHVGVYAGHWSFGVGFPIGAWLSYDCDWHYRRVYYTGWRVNHGWRVVAYPYIQVTPVYIHPRYDVVVINRTVIHRTVNYVNLRRYNTVHRTVTYDRPNRGAPGPRPRNVVDGRRDDDRNGNRPGGNGRDNAPDRGRDDQRDNGRTNGRGGDDGRGPDRARVVAPETLEDKRTQSSDDARRGGSVTEGKRPAAPPVRRAETARPTESEARPSRPNVARVPDVERRSAPPVRNSPPPSRSKPAAASRQSGGSSSRPAASSRPSGGSSSRPSAASRPSGGSSSRPSASSRPSGGSSSRPSASSRPSGGSSSRASAAQSRGNGGSVSRGKRGG